ncbi:VpaChn25_0724 family phage protein [Photobacterium sanguinicancri]|uniref:ArsR family transcriptional regulator n=1 Tax=Photobacterium sanguinicancri TaxID=875932 RepID=A0AAW7Y5N8_9GAMM|nr:ArsR family transcriptional regulator [Photobacterium sanguinicancri]MDO6542804.1 ArsR family transcriptional regulator [Photobacterium sanguinicancri]
MAITQILREHQRLVILRLLSEVPGYDLNESIIQDGLDRYGLDISRDALRAELEWLCELGLIILEKLGSTYIATLTGRGEDVASGRAKVSGIKKPRPGE